MRKKEDQDGWIDLRIINGFKRMQSLNLDISEVYEVLQNSTLVEVKHTFDDKRKFDKDQYFVRRVDPKMREEMGDLFGYNLE
mmetsp:Transcript_23683/g.27611  ORF Transcript_23683/g.27611 Transcript_23683/m.27611 type:complete len:82 (+) Transcript_23683:215-460(+)